MLLKEPLDFAKQYIETVNECITRINSGKKLSCHQRWWLSFCITAVVLTNRVNWSEFERISLGSVSLASLSWMFRCAKLPWERLLYYSTLVILNSYGISEGVLVLDDTDRRRSKNTTALHAVHKMKDEKSNGYMVGQNLVFLLLVTQKITIPVGFAFYQPDPAQRAWKLEDKRLKQSGISQQQRPPKPKRSLAYPTKQALGLKLLEQFARDFPRVIIRCILADALYGDQMFMDQASLLYSGTQVISQLRCNQIIRVGKREKNLKTYFHPGLSVCKKISIWGCEEKTVIVNSGRLWVKSHQKKRYIVALRYEGEQEDRYLIATDMTWRMTDIIEAYTIRWLVEVFFSDWKQYEGWCQLAKQPGVEGSYRGLILSLLTDHALLLHPAQAALLKHKLPASTVGSLRDLVRFDATFEFIAHLINTDDPEQQLTECLEKVKKVVVLRSSGKHLNKMDLSRLGPISSLRYRKAA